MNPVKAFLVEKIAAEKRGGFFSSLGRGMRFAETPAGTKGMDMFGHALGGQITAGAAMAGLAAGAHQAIKGVHWVSKKIEDKYKKPVEYKAMIQAHPELRKQDAGKVQMAFNSLRHMSPAMAKDPLIAGSFVRNILAIEPEGGLAVPPDMAKMLADTESKVRQSNRGDSDPVLSAFIGGGGKWVPRPGMEEPPHTGMPAGWRSVSVPGLTATGEPITKLPPPDAVGHFSTNAPRGTDPFTGGKQFRGGNGSGDRRKP